MADIRQVIADLQRQAGFAAGQSRQALDEVSRVVGEHAQVRQTLERQASDLKTLSQALASVRGGSIGGPNTNDHVMYIENIPGRRIPFDLLVEIPIGANVASEQQETVTISQDGPFVAVARFAAFLSQHQFERTDPETGARTTFQGRSFGRWRPISSSWDLNDAGAGVFNPIAGIAFPGTGAAIYASPSNHSSFRTMQFDGRIELLNQGAAYPRSNIRVPSAFWSDSINGPFQLGAMDFFERGEIIQIKATPTHTNNPNAGNASGYAAGGAFPFLGSQYDVHEGIVDPLDQVETTDPVARLPNGLLVIGLHGYRIVQPPGPVRMT